MQVNPVPQYKIVQTIPGRGMVATLTPDIYAWAEANSRETYRPAYIGHLRAELQAAPRIQGLCGPMWDGLNAAGQPVIRYEDDATNDTLSR
jgi:hypothetical protein